MKIVVMYLSWKHAPKDSYAKFLDSYLAHVAGVEHDLYVRANDDTQDIYEYFMAAHHINADVFCFLNSETRIEADNWLARLVEPLRSGEAVVCGSFASLENSPLGDKPFPNPHLRSNGFAILRDTLLRYPVIPRTKAECYGFESGPMSLTAWAEQEGLPVAFVSKTAVLSGVRGWRGPEVFRQGEQRDLLLSDNQSRHYQQADAEERARLAELAWGKP